MLARMGSNPFSRQVSIVRCPARLAGQRVLIDRTRVEEAYSMYLAGARYIEFKEERMERHGRTFFVFPQRYGVYAGGERGAEVAAERLGISPEFVPLSCRDEFEEVRHGLVAEWEAIIKHVTALLPEQRASSGQVVRVRISIHGFPPVDLNLPPDADISILPETVASGALKAQIFVGDHELVAESSWRTDDDRSGCVGARLVGGQLI